MPKRSQRRRIIFFTNIRSSDSLSNGNRNTMLLNLVEQLKCEYINGPTGFVNSVER